MPVISVAQEIHILLRNIEFLEHLSQKTGINFLEESFEQKNMKEKKIQDQIQILNEDYSLNQTNSDEKQGNVISSTLLKKIRFCRNISKNIFRNLWKLFNSHHVFRSSIKISIFCHLVEVIYSNPKWIQYQWLPLAVMTAVHRKHKIAEFNIHAKQIQSYQISKEYFESLVQNLIKHEFPKLNQNIITQQQLFEQINKNICNVDQNFYINKLFKNKMGLYFISIFLTDLPQSRQLDSFYLQAIAYTLYKDINQSKGILIEEKPIFMELCKLKDLKTLSNAMKSTMQIMYLDRIQSLRSFEFF